MKVRSTPPARRSEKVSAGSLFRCS
jgi:hypothetical protein